MRLFIKCILSIIAGYFLLFGIVGPSIYSKAVESMKEEVMKHLVTVRELKKIELEDYFSERRNDLMVFSANPLVTESFPIFMESFINKWQSNKENNAAAKEYKEQLLYHTKTYGYEDLFFINVNGNIVFAAINEKFLGINILDAEFIDPMMLNIFKQGRSKIAFSDFFWFDTFKVFAAYGVKPIMDRDDNVTGVLMFQLSFNLLDNIMKKRPGLRETGETYLVGQDKLLRSHSRFVEGTKSDQLKVATKATREAMKGHADVQVINNYKGKRVVSAYAPLEIENFNWSIIAKIEEDEIFSTIYQLRKLMYIVAGLLVVAISIYGFYVYRKGFV